MTAIPQVTVLHGHDSQENAYLIEDYPYGRQLRCQMRVWVDGPATKGQYKGQYRIMRQTSNPKRGNDWNNNPVKGQYAMMVILYLDGIDHDGAGTQHVEVHSFDRWGPAPHEDAIMHADGTYAQLTDVQRRVYDLFVKVNRAGNTDGWKRWGKVAAFVAAHLDAHGDVPAREDAQKGTGLGYINEREYEAACNIARHNAGL
jgi:hypothetical protein